MLCVYLSWRSTCCANLDASSVAVLIRTNSHCKAQAFARVCEVHNADDAVTMRPAPRATAVAVSGPSTEMPIGHVAQSATLHSTISSTQHTWQQAYHVLCFRGCDFGA